MPYRESPKRGSSLVKAHAKIAKHYLRSWFLLDVLSVIPVDTILMHVAPLGDAADAADGSHDLRYVEIFRVTRMLRLLRLIKLFRILRASRIFARWEMSLSAVRRANRAHPKKWEGGGRGRFPPRPLPTPPSARPPFCPHP